MLVPVPIKIFNFTGPLLFFVNGFVKEYKKVPFMSVNVYLAGVHTRKES